MNVLALIKHYNQLISKVGIRFQQATTYHGTFLSAIHLDFCLINLKYCHLIVILNVTIQIQQWLDCRTKISRSENSRRKKSLKYQ